MGSQPGTRAREVSLLALFTLLAAGPACRREPPSGPPSPIGAPAFREAAPVADPPPPGGPADEVAVEVKGLDTEHSTSPVVFLGPRDADLVLPIWIGPAEALAIAMELGNYRPPRPMTHDLFGPVFAALGARLERVSVTDLRGETFHARLYLRSGDRQVTLDSRPSDAIAIAMRLKAPIYVARKLLGDAGVRRSGPAALRHIARLGLRVQPLTELLAGPLGLDTSRGVLVADLEPRGPAARAGLRAGDLVEAVGERPVATLDELEAALAEAEAGPVLLRVRRASRRLQVRVEGP